MVETVTGSSGGDRLAAAAQLLHDFNVEYDEPAPPPDELAFRLAELVRGDGPVGPPRRGGLAVDAGLLFRLATAFDELRPAI